MPVNSESRIKGIARRNSALRINGIAQIAQIFKGKEEGKADVEISLTGLFHLLLPVLLQ